MELQQRETTTFNNETFYKITNPDVEDYWINTKGQVLSFKRGFPYILKPQRRSEYLAVSLVFSCGNYKSFMIHRLMGLNLLPKPNSEDKKYINHKDGNKFNNDINNLEWVSSGENQMHGFRVLGRKQPHEILLLLCNKENGFIFEPTNVATLGRKNLIPYSTLQKIFNYKEGFNNFYYYENSNQQIEQWFNGEIIRVFNNKEELAKYYNITVGKINARMKRHFGQSMKKFRIIKINDLYKDWTKTNIPYEIIHGQIIKE